MAFLKVFIVSFALIITAILFLVIAIAFIASALSNLTLASRASPKGNSFWISPVWLDTLLTKVLTKIGFALVLCIFMVAFYSILKGFTTCL